ncbi:rho GTPase-activating protein gacV-like [Metopolophium dirhodum]|uniref:rho GTPase-activating protein gacV-like n=1 Tax=Metopolophium dirhodum TaxID=44670 RepID=UPI00298F5444|nr:rho GTPase-activating protein gacV-like [Metopolophium dirhodum]XP_060868027.1 rho GTPase-activating protein gacV-like [Metopolophium dirhodum]
MGCAGSNPLPAGDAMVASATTDSRTVAVDPPPMSDTEKACSIVKKVVGSVNVDDVVKKIQDVGGSMENLMDETQEKFSSIFGKAEKQVNDVEKSVEDKVNDFTSTMPEKPKIQEVILLTVEETRVIPIDILKCEVLTNGNDAVVEEVNNNTKEEQTEIKAEDSHIDVNEKQNEEEDKVEEEKVEEEKVEEEKAEEEKVEEENVEEEKVEETKSEEEVKEEEEKEEEKIAEKEKAEEN